MRVYNLVCEKIAPLLSERRPLAECLDAVAAGDFHALVDVPSAATSLKEGYAVRAVDIAQTSSDAPVHLPNCAVVGDFLSTTMCGLRETLRSRNSKSTAARGSKNRQPVRKNEGEKNPV